MCAIDALGVAPMFATRIEVESRDSVSGEPIRARVEPDGAVEWSPESAVVVAGAIRNHGDVCCGCCPVLNFFASASTAEHWLAEHPEARGQGDLDPRGVRCRASRVRRRAYAELMPTPMDAEPANAR